MRLSTYQRLKSWFNETGGSADRSPGGMQELEPRLLLSAVLTQAVPTQHINALAGSAAINLNDYFDDTDITGTLVRYDTVYGIFDVELFDQAAPNTVTNFLGYVDRGDYDNTFFHRNALLGDGTPFVVQGGGFAFTEPSSYDSVFQGPSVVNEFGASNLRGTLAMAKLGDDPDSATNQWFFSMGDNSAILDGQNGGFTVFGEVKGSGMDVVDQIAATPIWDASSLNGAFTDLPLRDFTNDHFPNNNELVTVNSISRITQELTYSFVSSSAPTQVAAVVGADGVLTIFNIGFTQPKTVTITVQAEDYDGNTTQANITVELIPSRDSLNGDPFTDLIWRNFSDGRDTLWEMSSLAKTGTTALKQVKNTTWYIAATGDMNNDGHIDLIWRNAFDGQNKVWLMDGTTFVSAVDLRTVTNKNQSIGGVGDVNNDGHNDIVWRNSRNNRNIVWTMDGTTETGSIRLKNQNGADWYIGGVADFDTDGAVDIFWRNDNAGQNKIWLLNPFDGSLKSAEAVLTLDNPNWVVGTIGDYNLDSQFDVVFRNVKTGKHQVWIMNGTTRAAVRTNLKNLRNTDWQLPGRSSQEAAMEKAELKLQRLKNKAAKVTSASSSAVAIAASVQAAASTVSVLGEVEPIITLDPFGDEQDSGFVLSDDGHVVR